MTILVTGGAGYIGSHTVLALLDAGEEVCVIDDLSTGLRSAVPPRVPFIVGDVGDEELICRIIREAGVESVIHFAGSILVDESVEQPLKYYLNNTVSSRSVIAACVRENVRNFIFSSTAAVYGEPVTVPIGEDAPTAPVSPYGTSKLMVEIMLRDVALACPMRYTALRYFNVAGADPLGRTGQTGTRSSHLIKVACEAALGKRSHVEIFGTDFDTADGTGVRDYIHVSDLARAHHQALQRLRGGGDSAVMNCGYGHGYSVLDVIKAVRSVSEVDFDVRAGPRRPGDPGTLIADGRLLREELDWYPQHDDLHEIVSHALWWEQELAVMRQKQVMPA